MIQVHTWGITGPTLLVEGSGDCVMATETVQAEDGTTTAEECYTYIRNNYVVLSKLMYTSESRV